MVSPVDETLLLSQLRMIRRLNESQRVRVMIDGKAVEMPSWDAVEYELDALITFYENPATRTETTEAQQEAGRE